MQKDTQSHFYQEFETNKANWSVDFWLNQTPWMQALGVRAVDFETHPWADDVVSLLRIRQSLWHLMNQREQACWGAYWGIVYRKKYPLNKKFWNKFTQITQAIDNRQHHQQQLRQRIKELKNKDHNSEAKGSDLSRNLYLQG